MFTQSRLGVVNFDGFIHDGRISVYGGISLVKLILRNKEYEVKPGMTLLSALQKIDVVPESVIATREGEMILEDEILKDGDVIKLIAVISGGSCLCEEHSWRRSGAVAPWRHNLLSARGLLCHSPALRAGASVVPRNDGW
jgi:sulfur carrier protein